MLELFISFLFNRKNSVKNIFHLEASENLIFLLTVETSSKSLCLSSRYFGKSPRYAMACPTQDVKVN